MLSATDLRLLHAAVSAVVDSTEKAVTNLWEFYDRVKPFIVECIVNVMATKLKCFKVLFYGT